MNPFASSQPRGIYTLFFTEMWERFSYYGMRALLVLFLVDQTRGGFGFTDEIATAIYGLYTASVYLASLPGGWLADRLLGPQKAVLIGGVIISAGHFTIALDRVETFYLGLILIVIGTGLLKPNISALVADLYPEGGARRDAGFTIFYMGINLGAAIGPLVCSALGERVAWKYGFAAAGVGMALGVLQFHFTRRHLAAVQPIQDPLTAGAKKIALLMAVLAGAFIALAFLGVVKLDAVALAKGAKNVIVGIAVAYFLAVFLFFKLDAAEKKRVWLIVILFISSAIFWAGFEQAGSSLNLFAERHTTRNYFNFEIPAGWFQSINASFIILLAPVVAAVWLALARRRIDPSIPAKFGAALLFLSAGFATMALAAGFVLTHTRVAPTWLITTYLLHTIGELCLSPVGLSSITKLAPRRLVGQMMGVWFTATSLGNLLAGLLAGEMNSVEQMRAGFWKISILPAVTGIVLIALARPFQRWLQR